MKTSGVITVRALNAGLDQVTTECKGMPSAWRPPKLSWRVHVKVTDAAK
jgi:hypothetical protein